VVRALTGGPAFFTRLGCARPFLKLKKIKTSSPSAHARAGWAAHDQNLQIQIFRQLLFNS
jgi:hypothetical protein